MGIHTLCAKMAKSAISQEQYAKFRHKWFSFFSPVYCKMYSLASGYDNFICYLLPDQLPSASHSERFFSQRGQDWYLSTYIFPKTTKGFFLDIGANHPFNLSNTYYFENNGWSGMAFEPQPHIHTLWKDARKTPCYPLALGDQDDTISFNSIISDNWVHAMAYIDTGSDNRGEQLQGMGEKYIIEQIKVKQVRLDEFLRKNKISEIDFISMDVEGYEMNVLRGIDFSSVQIKCFVIENDATCIGDNTIRNFLKDKGYMHIARLSGDDVFVHTSHLPKVRNEAKTV
ncbi:FkbM family methyltransferase [Desulfocurvibacter africanus]|uniref:FkbM family methyltransferase n=1 Tax=Desulfocurvibacter africanus TaxID=873 RepID=UPI002FDB5401